MNLLLLASSTHPAAAASSSSISVRVMIIIGAALGAHLTVIAVRQLSRRALRSRIVSHVKIQTLTAFVASVLVFTLYFVAFGLTMRKLGVPLTAYFASASVIGLAVSFGSQGIVQDILTGLTVIFADLLDIGDMVDIGGQVGIVQRVTIRYTVLVNFNRASVYIPNRNVGNVINYPRGYVRAFLDVRLPSDPGLSTEAQDRIREATESAYDQFPGIMLAPPSVMGVQKISAGHSFLRVKFRVWPGQGGVIENTIRQSVIQELRSIEPGYADWMVAVHYRAEPKGVNDDMLPRPLPPRA